MQPPQPPAETADRAAAPRRWLLRLLRLALPVLLLALAWHWLLRHADFAALLSQARSLPLWLWLAAALALVCGHSLRALRLQRQWWHLRPLGLAHCLRLVLTHNAAVILLPLRSGEAGYLWLVYRHWGVSWRESGASLLVWRLQDATVLLLLAVALLLPWSPVARGLLMVCALITLACLHKPAQLWLARRWPGLVSAPGHSADRSADRWPDHWLRSGWLASAGNWSLKVLALGGLLMGLSGLDGASSLSAALGGELAGVQPLQGPAGLGSYEAGVWLAARASDTLQATVVAAALAVHAFALIIALGAAALAQLIHAPPLNTEPAPEQARAA